MILSAASADLVFRPSENALPHVGLLDLQFPCPSRSTLICLYNPIWCRCPRRAACRGRAERRRAPERSGRVAHRQNKQSALGRHLDVRIKIDGCFVVRLHGTQQAASERLDVVVQYTVVESNVQDKIQMFKLSFYLAKIVADFEFYWLTLSVHTFPCVPVVRYVAFVSC